MSTKTRLAKLLGATLLIGGSAFAQQGTGSTAPEGASTQCPMMGQQGGMMGGGMGGGGMCPMAGSQTQVTAENTRNGAVLRLTAKNQADVAKVQQMAQRMSQHMNQCMSGAAQQPSGAGQQ